MHMIRTILILSSMTMIGACVTTSSAEDDPAMRFENYKQCAAEQPPEKVAEMCGHYLN